jgi:hypothetical protein
MSDPLETHWSCQMKRPSVGLVIVETASYVLANNAIQHCINGFDFDQVLIFTDQPGYWPKYQTVVIPKISGVDDYNCIILEELPKAISVDFVLIVHFDGFVLHPERLSEDFFDCDYIGSCRNGGSGRQAGRGVFSWRSRRLVEAAVKHVAMRAENEAEDAFISQKIRPMLESDYGCRFADDAIAMRFSAEDVGGVDSAFGFQGAAYLPLLYQGNPSFLIDNLPDDVLKQEYGLICQGVDHLLGEERVKFKNLLLPRLAGLGINAPLAAEPKSSESKLFEHLWAMGHSRNPAWTAYEDKPPCDDEKRIIAYYLPQFHSIPENDANWGKGFTEWRNVARALPLFEGHYQPRQPADLGFYDLNNQSVLAQQAQLARNYGINGWAFYHYWFDSKRLLDMPIEQLYKRPEVDINYCVFWANENWTRSWDGLQSNVLLSQKHSPEDDIAFIEAVSKYFEDARYIRFEGRPVLMMYRPMLLPDALATTERWRNWCVRRGLGNPYLIATEAYGLAQPSAYGFDASAEFPPHRGRACNASLLQSHDIKHQFGPSRDIQCIDYASAVEAWSHLAPEGSDKLFKCVFPMWDNSSRRVSSTPSVFQGATPELYEQWLRFCLEQAQPNDFVFVNAWNEWAEGAYLEPDLHFGHAYLEATWRARNGSKKTHS